MCNQPKIHLESAMTTKTNNAIIKVLHFFRSRISTKPHHISKDKSSDNQHAPITKLTEGVSHVGLAVSDLAASLAFFEALGFSKVGGVQDYPSHFLSDGSTLITLWQTDENPVPFDRRKNVGLHHFAIKVTSEDALNEAYDKVMAVKGVKSEFSPQELPGMPLTHAMIYEPSGNRIELTYHSQ